MRRRLCLFSEYPDPQRPQPALGPLNSQLQLLSKHLVIFRGTIQKRVNKTLKPHVRETVGDNVTTQNT